MLNLVPTMISLPCRWYVKLMRRGASPPRGGLDEDHELNQYVVEDTHVDDYFDAGMLHGMQIYCST